jgi:hypothetical protein
MATLRFEPNVPVELALKYDEGRQVQSRILDAPDQMMYTVCGDDTIYLPLHVAEQIKALGIRKMELISICKTVKGNVTRWEVKRVGGAQTAAIAPRDSFEALPTAINASPLERQLTQSINVVKAQRMSQAPAAPLPQQPSKAPDNTPNSTPAAIHHTSYSRVMAAALIAAIDASREAERYATKVGFEVEFNTEDVRAIAATLFIQASKDPAFLSAPTQKVNGGTSWPQ